MTTVTWGAFTWGDGTVWGGEAVVPGFPDVTVVGRIPHAPAIAIARNPYPAHVAIGREAQPAPIAVARTTGPAPIAVARTNRKGDT